MTRRHTQKYLLKYAHTRAHALLLARHPYLRLLVCVPITFLNFLIFAEDPIADSFAPCQLPVIGNGLSLLFRKWPDQTLLLLLKIATALTSVVGGMLVGFFFLHHYLLRDKLQLVMFREDCGTWFVMFLNSIISLFVGSLVYNEIVKAAADEPTPWLLDSGLGITNQQFGRMGACGTFLGDGFTAFMVSIFFIALTSKCPCS